MDFDTLTKMVMGNSGALALSWIALFFCYRRLIHCEDRHDKVNTILLKRFGIDVNALERRNGRNGDGKDSGQRRRAGEVKRQYEDDENEA